VRVLVIEDEPAVARVVARALEQETEYAVDVDVSDRVAEGTRRALDESYDAILLDLELPDGNGLEVVRALRNSGRNTPILIMTGRGDDESIVRGLDAGADDYLLKPLNSNDVLRARVRAAIRRGGSGPPDQLSLGELFVDRLARVVTGANGAPVSLTPKEFSMLEYLLLHADQVVSRTELLDKVWNMKFDPGSNVVDAHVARLRQKLRQIISTPEIRTVRGIGFMLSAKPEDDER
jgi:two-component system OmpR family response regulator